MCCLVIGKAVGTAGVMDLWCKSQLDFPAPAQGNGVCERMLGCDPGLKIAVPESWGGLALHRGG